MVWVLVVDFYYSPSLVPSYSNVPPNALDTSVSQAMKKPITILAKLNFINKISHVFPITGLEFTQSVNLVQGGSDHRCKCFFGQFQEKVLSHGEWEGAQWCAEEVILRSMGCCVMLPRNNSLNSPVQRDYMTGI